MLLDDRFRGGHGGSRRGPGLLPPAGSRRAPTSTSKGRWRGAPIPPSGAAARTMAAGADCPWQTPEPSDAPRPRRRRRPASLRGQRRGRRRPCAGCSATALSVATTLGGSRRGQPAVVSCQQSAAQIRGKSIPGASSYRGVAVDVVVTSRSTSGGAAGCTGGRCCSCRDARPTPSLSTAGDPLVRCKVKPVRLARHAGW